MNGVVGGSFAHITAVVFGLRFGRRGCPEPERATCSAREAGEVVAVAKVGGTSGSFEASATAGVPAPGLLVTGLQTNASGNTNGNDKGRAAALIGGVASLNNAPSQQYLTKNTAIALATGLPLAANTAAILDANPNIATAFSGSPVFFATGELGGGYARSGGSGAETITDTVDIDIDLTKLASPGNLILGLFNPTAHGIGFSSLDFTLAISGGATLVNESFTSVSAAETFFTDEAMDLGSLASAPFGGSSLDLVATFTLTTTDAFQGFYAQFILGDPPPTRRFAQAMAGMGGGSGGYRLGTNALPSYSRPNLIAPR